LCPVYVEEPEESVRLGWLAKIRVFLSEVREELKMLTFSPWQEVRSMMAMVIFVISLLASYLYILDQISKRLLDPLLFHR
jgi:preprotein translocase subunit SecE